MSKENAILADMQKQVWVMEPRHLNALFTHLLEVEVKVPKDVEVVKQQNKLSITGDMAIIKMSGILLKNIPSLYRWLGIEMTSYLDIQQQLNEAMANQAVKKILLDIDSPGGVVAGVMETGNAIAQAAAMKNLTAKIDDLGASGAYWLASQASKITAGPNAEVGSIGVFTVYLDSSVRADREGFKVNVVRSGKHKGMGVPGAEITAEQLDAVQEIIDGIADNFISAVSSGRKMTASEVRKLADGRTFLAKEAKEKGLIDNIINVKANKVKEKKNMAEEEKIENSTETEKKPDAEAIKEEAAKENQKRLAELKKEFPDEPQFVLEQFEAGHNIEQAKAAYADVLKERNTELEKQNTELKKKAEKKASEGATPVPSGGEGDEGDSNFMQMAKERAREDKCSMTEAMRKIRRENPQIYEAYINECQQKQVKGDEKD